MSKIFCIFSIFADFNVFNSKEVKQKEKLKNMQEIKVNEKMVQFLLNDSDIRSLGLNINNIVATDPLITGLVEKISVYAVKKYALGNGLKVDMDVDKRANQILFTVTAAAPAEIKASLQKASDDDVISSEEFLNALNTLSQAIMQEIEDEGFEDDDEYWDYDDIEDEFLGVKPDKDLTTSLDSISNGNGFYVSVESLAEAVRIVKVVNACYQLKKASFYREKDKKYILHLYPEDIKAIFGVTEYAKVISPEKAAYKIEYSELINEDVSKVFLEL